jgi:hypothetical protein
MARAWGPPLAQGPLAPLGGAAKHAPAAIIPVLSCAHIAGLALSTLRLFHMQGTGQGAGAACLALLPTLSLAAVCAQGYWSLTGSDPCTGCPLGRYGSTTSVTNPLCVGPCDPGRYGAAIARSDPTCTGEWCALKL